MNKELAHQETNQIDNHKLSGFLRALLGATAGILFFTIVLLSFKLTDSLGTLISLVLFLPGLIVLNILQVSSSASKELWDAILYSVSYIPYIVTGILFFSGMKTARKTGLVLLCLYVFLSLSYGLYAALVLTD